MVNPLAVPRWGVFNSNMTRWIAIGLMLVSLVALPATAQDYEHGLAAAKAPARG